MFFWWGGGGWGGVGRGGWRMEEGWLVVVIFV